MTNDEVIKKYLNKYATMEITESGHADPGIDIYQPVDIVKITSREDLKSWSDAKYVVVYKAVKVLKLEDKLNVTDVTDLTAKPVRKTKRKTK